MAQLPPPDMGYVERAWESFYTGDFQTATSTIEQHIKTRENDVKCTPASWVLHARTLIELYTIAGTRARDNMETPCSLAYLTKAKEAAESHGDTDLLVVTLVHLINAYMQFGLLWDAECVLDLAFVYLKPADWPKSNVKAGVTNISTIGLVHLAAGELYSTLSTQSNTQDSPTFALKHLDKAEHVWNVIGQDSLSHHMRLTMARVLNERSTFLARQGNNKAEAQRVLARAKSFLPEKNVRNAKDFYVASSGSPND